MKLIGADEFLAEASKQLDMQDLYLPIHIKDMVIDAMPTVDAVPVVRCKDCIHRPIGDPCKHNVQPPKENDYRCPCLCEDDWYSWTPTDDWFCGNGERK